MGPGRRGARPLVRRLHGRRRRRPGSLRRGVARLAARRRARQCRRMDRGGCPQPRPGSAATRIRPPGKGTRSRGGRHPSPHRSRGRASRSRRRTADDVHLRAPRARPDLTAGADAAADLGTHRRRDRAGAVAVRSGRRSADHPRQEQDPARQHPATGAARRTAAGTHTARAGLYLFGVHRGLLVDGGTVGHPRRAVRRGRAPGRRTVLVDA